MAASWVTVAPGIRCREHETRKHGVKPDRYFTLRFYVEGKRVEEALGWSSEGWTLTKAQAQLVALKEAKRTGGGDTSLREKRATAQADKQARGRAAAESERLAVEEEERRRLPDAALKPKKEHSIVAAELRGRLPEPPLAPPVAPRNRGGSAAYPAARRTHTIV